MTLCHFKFKKNDFFISKFYIIIFFIILTLGFVYEFGSARPVAHVKYANGKFSFSIPPQYEPGLRYQDFEFSLNGEDQLTGTMVYTDGKTYTEAAKNGEQVIESLILWYQEQGKSLPEPMALPEKSLNVA